MSKRLAIELLNKYSNPSSCSSTEIDDDGAVSNVPQRIASRHTGRGRRVLADQAAARPTTRPRSLLPERDVSGDAPAVARTARLPDESRVSSRYDDSPIIDLDAEDDLARQNLFPGLPARTTNVGDTVKRNVYHRQSSEDWSVASLMSCPKHNPLQDLATDTMPSSENKWCRVITGDDIMRMSLRYFIWKL
ncbi:uncharacterized protein LOC114358882 [Ostrinia furnacalis]|uniref:uncharacterized protein LOC114358882 n=1 Tax=Ostrinia furnacalis TaxID=93504 RepID=UPI00103DEF54|nr:uncharacterized protein LOC114358882 [Ostrinia furnacalis]XP_028168845.1 uncharacterized protein LOC114358882 [Ostrinia furnacalis]